MCSHHVYISVSSTNKAPIEWIRMSDIGSCIIAPRLSCLNTVTMIALSWIQDGGTAGYGIDMLCLFKINIRSCPDDCGR
jgi:hypothetical protein